MPFDSFDGSSTVSTPEALRTQSAQGYKPEPFPFLFGHGLIIKDGAKMSKSRGNVVVPDEYIEKYGADALRMYLMFIGPYDQGGDFSEAGMAGMKRFLNRWWGMFTNKVTISEKEDNEMGMAGWKWIGGETSPELKSKLQETIAKAGTDYAHFRFNTAIAAIMELVNSWRSGNQHLALSDAKECVKLLAPLAPFMSEELWQGLGGEGSVHRQSFPEVNEMAVQEKPMLVVVQVNGRLRGTIERQEARGMTQEEIEKMAREKVVKWLEGKEVKRVVWVAPAIDKPGEQHAGQNNKGLVNFVVG